MQIGVGLAAGVAAVAWSIWVTARLGRRGGRNPAARVRFEQVSWALYLGVAALVYVGFALREAGRPWLVVELAGVAAYGFVAWLGTRGDGRWIALGWLLHAAWDMALHAHVPDAFVPTWYRYACLSFDLIAATYLFTLRPEKADR